MIDYDRDPEALAWARAKVQRRIDKAQGFQPRTGDTSMQAGGQP
jgi:hypothetical protein